MTGIDIDIVIVVVVVVVAMAMAMAMVATVAVSVLGAVFVGEVSASGGNDEAEVVSLGLALVQDGVAQVA